MMRISPSVLPRVPLHGSISLELGGCAEGRGGENGPSSASVASRSVQASLVSDIVSERGYLEEAHTEDLGDCPPYSRSHVGLSRRLDHLQAGRRRAGAEGRGRGRSRGGSRIGGAKAGSMLTRYALAALGRTIGRQQWAGRTGCGWVL